MAYAVTVFRQQRCRQCDHPAWRWFPKGSDADARRKSNHPAAFLVGSPTAAPAGPVRLCERHARALVGDALVDSALAKEVTPE